MLNRKGNCRLLLNGCDVDWHDSYWGLSVITFVSVMLVMSVIYVSNHASFLVTQVNSMFGMECKTKLFQLGLTEMQVCPRSYPTYATNAMCRCADRASNESCSCYMGPPSLWKLINIPMMALHWIDCKGSTCTTRSKYICRICSWD